MRSPHLQFCFSLLFLCSAVQAQIFPTLDPNASPPVTMKTAADPSDNDVPAAADANPPNSHNVKRAVSGEEALTASPDAKPDTPDPTMFSVKPPNSYVVGPQDTLLIRVVDMEELGDDPYPVDLTGNITLPRVGRVHAAGLTVEQLQLLLTREFKEYLQEPAVTVSVAAFHSQPVSILGAVEEPGVHQIQGNKTLFEVISEAGGLKDDAGNTITITRQLSRGPLPLPNAQTDPSGRYSIAELNIRSLMSAKNPQDNIPVLPYDVITVPKADLIYVIGAVKRPGGFPLRERANMTVLQALSLSEGLDRTAASHNAKILRNDETTHARLEIPIDVKKILDGKISDQILLSNDILFIPNSTAKIASTRALEALITTGTGIAIYRP